MSANYDLIRNSSTVAKTAYANNFITVQNANTGKMVYKNAGYYAVDDKRVITQISPSTSAPSSLNNAQVDFKIESPLDSLQYISLQMQLTNNTGANVTVVGAPLWISKVDVYSENGNKLIFTTTDQELFLSFLYLDSATYLSQNSTYGLSPTYASTGAIIADAASVTFNLPFYQFWHAVNLAVSLIQAPLLVRVFFNPTSQTNITGTALTCTNLSLILRGEQLKEDSKNELRKFYNPSNRIPLSLSHLAVDRMAITQNLVASQQVPITLVGLRGACAFMVFTIRLAANIASPVNQIAYVRMQDFDILNGQSNSLIGAFRRSLNSQQIDYSNNFHNQAWINSNFQMISWSSDPKSALANGDCSGYCILSGNERLIFNCPVGMASGSYQIDIRAYMYENLEIEKGQIRPSRS